MYAVMKAVKISGANICNSIKSFIGFSHQKPIEPDNNNKQNKIIFWSIKS